MDKKSNENNNNGDFMYNAAPDVEQFHLPFRDKKNCRRPYNRVFPDVNTLGRRDARAFYSQRFFLM